MNNERLKTSQCRVQLSTYIGATKTSDERLCIGSISTH